MDDALSLFDDGPAGVSKTEPAPPALMTDSQRQSIKRGFEELRISVARDQFAVVLELTGQRITSVGQLEARHAQTLIFGLEEKIRTAGRQNTGNAWADRQEDTWIDKL